MTFSNGNVSMRIDGESRTVSRPVGRHRLRRHEGRTPYADRGPTANLHMSARAGILITGTEVLTGRVTDRNGPWLSDRLRELGVDLAQIVIVGDRPSDMHDGLGWLAGEGVDLIITSGGLGPTEDDLHGADRRRVPGPRDGARRGRSRSGSPTSCAR